MHSLVPDCPSLDCKVMKALKSISNLHIVVENKKKWSLIFLSKKSKKLTSESCFRGHLGPICKNLERVHVFFWAKFFRQISKQRCGPTSRDFIVLGPLEPFIKWNFRELFGLKFLMIQCDLVQLYFMISF